MVASESYTARFSFAKPKGVSVKFHSDVDTFCLKDSISNGTQFHGIDSQIRRCSNGSKIFVLDKSYKHMVICTYERN
jgi:hypothetical protein